LLVLSVQLLQLLSAAVQHLDVDQGLFALEVVWAVPHEAPSTLSWIGADCLT
jgi:hypothetical protein